jgi:hypothetical protein
MKIAPKNVFFLRNKMIVARKTIASKIDAG